jgi:hypothetical protein
MLAKGLGLRRPMVLSTGLFGFVVRADAQRNAQHERRESGVDLSASWNAFNRLAVEEPHSGG